jgi:gamma-glutamylputrescine oxidase
VYRFEPADSVYWYQPSLQAPALSSDLTCDVVVIGGGMAGLSAAAAFQKKGCSVIVLEKSFCGAGASGKSSGFITPDAEFSLHALVEKYGPEKGHALWGFVSAGVTQIRNNVEAHQLSCDFHVQDTFIAASSESGFAKEVADEFNVLRQFGYEASLYTRSEMPAVIGSPYYYGGVRYPQTFGISAFLYLQQLGQVLQTTGVKIFEESPVIEITKNSVRTPSGSVSAQFVICCVDRWAPELSVVSADVTQMQTFLLCSKPLSEKQTRQIFPDKPLMVWDTELVFNYYRLIFGNRLVLGGANLWSTYTSHATHDNKGVYKKLSRYFKKMFPTVSVEFSYMWPGLIGVSKDIMPLAGRDPHNSSLYYISGTAGLPWAAALGEYSADCLIDGRIDFDEYFSAERHFIFGSRIQKILGKKITFALSHVSTLSTF